MYLDDVHKINSEIFYLIISKYYLSCGKLKQMGNDFWDWDTLYVFKNGCLFGLAILLKH